MDHRDLKINTEKWKDYQKKFMQQQFEYQKIVEAFNPAAAEQTVRTWKNSVVQNAKLGDIQIIKKNTGWFGGNPIQNLKSYVIGIDSKATYFCGIKPTVTKQFYRGCCYFENPKEKVYQIMGEQLIAVISLQAGYVLDFRFYSKTKKGGRQQRIRIRMEGKATGYIEWGDKPKQKLQRKFTGKGKLRDTYYSVFGQKVESLRIQKTDRVIYFYLQEKANQISLLQYMWFVTGTVPFFFPFTLNNFTQFNHNADRKHLQICFRSSSLLESMFHQMYPNHPRCSPPFKSQNKYDVLSFQVFQKEQLKKSNITQQQTNQRKQRHLRLSRDQRQNQELKQQIQRFRELKTQYVTNKTIETQKNMLKSIAQHNQNSFKKKTFTQVIQSINDLRQYKQTSKIPQQYINLTKKTFNLQQQGIINQAMALYQPNSANQTFTMKDYTVNNSFINQTFGNPNETFRMKDVTMNNSMNQTFILKDLQKNNMSMNQSYGMHDYSKANISMNQTYNMKDISKANILNESKINNKWSLQKLYQQNKISPDLKQNMMQNRNLKFINNQKQLQEKKKLLRTQNIQQKLNDFPTMKQDLKQDDFSNPFITFFSSLGINQQKGIHFNFMEKMSQTMIRISMRYFLYVSSYNDNIQYQRNEFITIFNDIVSNFLIINIQIDFILYPTIDHYLAIVYFFNRFQVLDPQIPQLLTTDLYQYYSRHSHEIQFQVSSDEQASKQRIVPPQYTNLKNQIVSLIKKIDDNFTILQNCFFSCSLKNLVYFKYDDIQNICMQIIKNCYMFFVSLTQSQQQISLTKRNKMLDFKKNRLLSIVQLVNVKILLLISLSLVVMTFFQIRNDKKMIQIKRSRQENSSIFHRLSQYVANLLLIARITSFNVTSLRNFVYQEENCILRNIDYININRKYDQFEFFLKDSNDPRLSNIFLQGFHKRSNTVREIMSKLKKFGKKNIRLLQYIQQNLGRIKQKHHKMIDKALGKLQPKIKRHITNIIKPDLSSQVIQHIADILNEVNLNFSIDREKNLLGLTLSCKSINYTNRFQLYKGNEKLNDFMFLCGRNLGIILTDQEEDTQKQTRLVNDLFIQSKQRLQKNKSQFIERQKVKLNLLGLKQQNFQLTQSKQMETIQQIFKEYSSKLLTQIQSSRSQENVEKYLLNQATYIAFQQNQTIIKKVLVGVLTKTQFLQGNIMPQIIKISKQKMNEINLLDESKFEIIKKQFGQQGTFYSIQKWMQNMLNYNLQISFISWQQIEKNLPKVMEIYTQLIRDVNEYMLSPNLDVQMQNRKIILRGFCSFFISMIDKINQDKGQLFNYFFVYPFQKALQFQVHSTWIQTIFTAITQQYKQINYSSQITVKTISKHLNKKLQTQFQLIQKQNSQRFEKYQQIMRHVVANFQRNAELLVNRILKMEQNQKNLLQKHHQISNIAQFKDRDQLQYKRQALKVICESLQIKADTMPQLRGQLQTRIQQLIFSTQTKEKLNNLLKSINSEFNQEWQGNLNSFIKIQKNIQIALRQQIALKQQQLRMSTMVDDRQLIQAKYKIQNLLAQGTKLQDDFNKLVLANKTLMEQKDNMTRQFAQIKADQKKYIQQVNRINDQNTKKFAALGTEMTGKKQQLKRHIQNLDLVNKDLVKTKNTIAILQQQIRNYQQMRQQFIRSITAYQSWIERLSNRGLQKIFNDLNMSQIQKNEKSMRDEIQQSRSVIQQMNNILQKVLQKDAKYNKVVQQFSTFKNERQKQINNYLQRITELEGKVKKINEQQQTIKKQKANKQIDIKTKQLLTKKQDQAKKLAAEKELVVKQLAKKAQQLTKLTQEKNKAVQQMRNNLARGLADQTTKKATQQYIEKKTKQYTDKIKNFQAKQKKKIEELLLKKNVESLFQAYQNIQQYLQLQKTNSHQSDLKKKSEQMNLQGKGFNQLLNVLAFNVNKAQQNLDKKKKSLQQTITKQLSPELKKKVIQQFQKQVNKQQEIINQIVKDLKSEIQERGKIKVGQVRNNQSQMKQIRDRIKQMTENIYQVDTKFIQAAKIALDQAKKKTAANQKQSQDLIKLEQKVKQLKQVQKKHQKLLNELKFDQIKLTFKLTQKQKEILMEKVKKHVQENLRDLYARYFQVLESQISTQGGFQRSTKIMLQITKIIQTNPDLAKKMNVQIKIPTAPAVSPSVSSSVSSPPLSTTVVGGAPLLRGPAPTATTVPPSSNPPPLPKSAASTHPLSGHNSQQIDKVKKNLLIQKKTSAILFQILMNLVVKIKQCFSKMNQLAKRWEQNASKTNSGGDKDKCLALANVYGVLAKAFDSMVKLPDTIAGKYAAQDLHDQVKKHYDSIMSMSIDSFNMTTYLNSFGSS